MFCVKCGSQIGDDSSFCAKCGVKTDTKKNLTEKADMAISTTLSGIRLVFLFIVSIILSFGSLLIYFTFCRMALSFVRYRELFTQHIVRNSIELAILFLVATGLFVVVLKCMRKILRVLKRR
jgi:uncharacterized membrane protein YvbJ